MFPRNSFASVAEAKDYPYFATQFHPEKNAYEWEQAWCSDPDVPSAPTLSGTPAGAAAAHSTQAVAAMAHMASVFVGAARQSSHAVPPAASAMLSGDRSVYGKAPLYTGGGLIPPKNMQTYVFEFGGSGGGGGSDS